MDIVSEAYFSNNNSGESILPPFLSPARSYSPSRSLSLALYTEFILFPTNTLSASSYHPATAPAGKHKADWWKPSEGEV